MTAEPTLTERHRRQLVMALGLFDLTDRDRRLIDWLATWDQPTIDAIEDLFDRLIRPAVDLEAVDLEAVDPDGVDPEAVVSRTSGYRMPARARDELNRQAARALWGDVADLDDYLNRRCDQGDDQGDRAGGDA